MATKAVKKCFFLRENVTNSQSKCSLRAFSRHYGSYNVCNSSPHSFRQVCLKKEAISRRTFTTSSSRKYAMTFLRDRRLHNKNNSILVSYETLKFDNVNQRSYAKQQLSKTHFYNVLKTTPNATQSQIKAAYYELSKTYHPDVNKDPGAHVMFSEITEAYEILGNVRNRRLYDRGIYHPQRRPVQDDDDDQDPFQQNEGFRQKRTTPPTGRTSTYNFDEFYRQHYGDTLRRASVRRAKNAQQEKELSDMKNRRNGMILMLTMIYSLGLFSFWMIGRAPQKGPVSSKKG